MCGISGKINFDNQKVQKSEMKSMMKLMKHRGPDDEGIFIDNNIGFGFVRLSIIDLTNLGHQPMFDASGNYMITHNGEVYNYLEIRHELVKKGYKFKSNTDTEVILNAYIEWGERCVHKFNGMWAFCIFDRNTKNIFISRDRYGIKPLYYYYDNDTFIFASEIPPILSLLKSKPNANYSSIYDYLIFNRTDHSNQTFFKEIKKLKHGHNIRIFNKEIKVKRWYNLKNEISEPFKDFDEYRSTLTSSIKLRLRSDVPVGVCLSGGIDSSAITSLLIKNIKKDNLFTFSAIFNENDKEDESKFIKEFENFKINMKFIKPDSKSLFDDLGSFLKAHSEPVPTTSIYAQFKVMDLASKNVVVTLDGQGADEQLAGYHYFYGFLLKDLLKSLKIIDFFKENYYAVKRCKSLFAQKSLLYFLLPNKLRAKIKHNQKLILSKDFFHENYDKSNISKLLYDSADLNVALLDHFEHKLEHLLKWGDRNSMNFSLESRLPFLDYRLVEKTLALPNNLIINKGRTKYILRKSMQGIIPEKIVNRYDKMGFQTPQNRWFKEGGMKSLIKEIISSKSFSNRNIFSASKTKNYINKYNDNKGGDVREIWKMVNLELWFRNYID